MLAYLHQDWIYGILLLLAVLLVGNGIHYFVFRFLRRKQTDMKRRNLGLRKHLARPVRGVLLLIGLRAILPIVPRISTPLLDQMEQLIECMLVLFLGWLAVGFVYVFQAFMLSYYDTSVADNLRARRVHTQMQFFRRVIIAIVVLTDAGALLWSLHDARLWKFGTGFFASAGLVSLILATASKSTASNLIAGMQIALSEPIRIDDVVVLQGEWGRIEEITSTYVVVKIWDERRLVVPLSYFIEQSFENWTRSRGDLLGTAFLYVDYSAPIELLREELLRIAKATPLWDRRACGLQVTNLTDRTMEIRCLVSASGSSECFDLRCLVREKMVDYLKKNHPDSLPTQRIRIEDNEILAANKLSDR